MSCITAFASPAAMATRQLAQANGFEISVWWPMATDVNRKRLNMSWVVVTDDSGKRRVEARWTGSSQSWEETAESFCNVPLTK